ncbi:hypothetical protein L1887_47881 [Cichorium endivia]|nr:hypothetical protein L1887_47881 [Cichorium endivia]
MLGSRPMNGDVKLTCLPPIRQASDSCEPPTAGNTAELEKPKRLAEAAVPYEEPNTERFAAPRRNALRLGRFALLTLTAPASRCRPGQRSAVRCGAVLSLAGLLGCTAVENSFRHLAGAAGLAAARLVVSIRSRRPKTIFNPPSSSTANLQQWYVAFHTHG